MKRGQQLYRTTLIVPRNPVETLADPFQDPAKQDPKFRELPVCGLNLGPVAAPTSLKPRPVREGSPYGILVYDFSIQWHIIVHFRSL